MTDDFFYKLLAHLENGPVHGGASYAIVGGSQQQQLSNLQANSSHLQNGIYSYNILN